MRHYLDFAATSAIRPPSVGRAMADSLAIVEASDSGTSLAAVLEQRSYRWRAAVAHILGHAGDPDRVAFMFSATHAINTALRGVLGRGDVVVVSPYDHNAVLRPLHALQLARDVEVRMLSGDASGAVDMDEAGRLLEGARLLVVTAVSNVLGTALPVQQLAQEAHAKGALVLVDAAQSAGRIAGSPVDEGADLVAVTGHKGLLGPKGTGALWVRAGVGVEPLLRGGTGGDARSRDMPPDVPARLEAGTWNEPGMAGMLAGCEFVTARSVSTIHAHEARLKAHLRQGLQAVPGVRVLSPLAPDGVGIVTIVADALDAVTLAGHLERDFGVICRPGLHNAPEIHRILGADETGAVRLSVGWATTEEDVDAAIRAVAATVRRPAFTTAGR